MVAGQHLFRPNGDLKNTWMYFLIKISVMKKLDLLQFMNGASYEIAGFIKYY